MRPYLFFVSGVAGMAGVALAETPQLSGLLLAFVCFFFSYGFGQALTDCFQMDTDALSSPYRPLVKGQIHRSTVLTVSLIGLCGSSLILFILNPINILFGLLCTSGLLSYTWFKRHWWGGPLWNAWIVAMLPVMGFYSFSSAHELVSSYKAAVWLSILISVFFSYANFVVMGYFKDISADRVSGYNTFNVVFGWHASALVSDLFSLISILATGAVLFLTLSFQNRISQQMIALIPFAAAILALLRAQIRIHKIRQEHLAFNPIENVVRGFILLHMAEILVLKPEWLVAATLFYALFEIVLLLRPMKEQV